LIVALVLLTLFLTYALVVALALGLCSENQRYEICDTGGADVTSWVLLTVPTAAVVIAGLTLSRRAVLIVFGAFAALVAATIVTLSLTL
jgi:hypothetical protein